MNDRLQIAAMAMQGELANNASDANGISLDYYVGGALAYADALIANEKETRPQCKQEVGQIPI